MSEITLSRGATSVTIDAVGETSRPTVVYSQSKPQQDITPVSNVDPRSSDQFQSVPQFTINGYLKSTTAYEDARTLCEDLIKPHSGGSDLTLGLSNVSGFGSYTVAPNSDSAVSVTYTSGQRDLVEVELQLTKVDTTVGGAATESFTSSTVTPGNGGSVTLSNPANGESVTLNENLSVKRSVGRPSSTVRPNPTSVTYIDKVRSASDTFELSGRLTDASARTDAVTLIEDVLGTPLGRDSLTLTFNNNLYGYDTFDVVPVGSRAGRAVVNASEKGLARVNGVTLRTITT